MVLDNASGADQVRPLLPGTGTCAVVVTSRDALGGLVARDGVHPVHLAAWTGPTRSRCCGGWPARASPAGTAAMLAERCAGLPLALRVAATRHFVEDLPDDGPGLDAFDADGDPRTALRSVFSWSLRQLSPAGAAAFRWLGLHPGRVVDAAATAALAGVPPPAGRAMLDELARAHLVEPAGAGGYGMHDLLHAYSADLAGQLAADESRSAVDRLTAHLLRTATSAAATLFPHDHPDRPAPTSSTVDTPERALRWLDRERAALVALSRSRAAVELSRVLWRYLEVGGHYRDALTVHTAAAEHGAADVHTNLGAIHWLLGDHARAQVHFGQSLRGHRAAGDAAGEARATARLALVHERLGDHDEAATRLRAALAMYRAVGDRHGEAAQLLNLGFTYHRAHRHTKGTRPPGAGGGPVRRARRPAARGLRAGQPRRRRKSDRAPRAGPRASAAGARETASRPVTVAARAAHTGPSRRRITASASTARRSDTCGAPSPSAGRRASAASRSRRSTPSATCCWPPAARTRRHAGSRPPAPSPSGPATGTAWRAPWTA